MARELNRENQDGYSLLVMAYKNGKTAVGYVSIENDFLNYWLYSNCCIITRFSYFILQVSISVIDVNDETPEFNFKVYKGQIDENLLPGSSVLYVKAVDADEEDTVKICCINKNN